MDKQAVVVIDDIVTNLFSEIQTKLPPTFSEVVSRGAKYLHPEHNFDFDLVLAGIGKTSHGYQYAEIDSVKIQGLVPIHLGIIFPYNEHKLKLKLEDKDGVLIIADNSVSARKFEKMLREAGYKIFTPQGTF